MGALSYVRSYFGGAAKTTLNVAIYAATLGKFVLLEGRVSGGIFENWAGRFPTWRRGSLVPPPKRRSWIW